MKVCEKGEKPMINFILIVILSYEVIKLNNKVNRNSRFVGELLLDDLDEEFWTD